MKGNEEVFERLFDKEEQKADDTPEIFKGLKISEEVSRELARYWAAAGNCCGYVDARGHLHTQNYLWNRPISGSSYEVLRDGLKDQKVDFIIVSQGAVFINFEKLQYNLEWLAKTIKEGQHGAKDTKKGLQLYCRRPSCKGEWYDDSFAWWPFKGITVKMLQDMGALKRSELVKTSPIGHDSFEELYFAE